VQLIKSLFCWHGFDNRFRFSLIHTLCYLGVIFFALAFSLLFFALLAMLLITVYTAATKRRIQDAELPLPWLYACSAIFALTAIIIIFVESNLAFSLLLMPAVFTGILLTYPSKGNKSYILGYNGPVDLTVLQQSKSSGTHQAGRIEPTFNQGEKASNIELNNHAFAVPSGQETAHLPPDSSPATGSGQDIGEAIRLQIMQHKKLAIGLVAAIALVVVVTMVSLMINEQGPEAPLPTQEVLQPEVTRLHPVELPDSFTILMSEHRGVIINWQADETQSKEIWQLASAQGDKSCQSISFNNGDEIRTTSVTVEGGSNYFANFSPLDTQKIIKNIAFRGKFTLCDYTFSLKGSQAALGKHPVYAEIVEY